MKKIPCLFERDNGPNTLVRNVVAAGCEWVIVGEGVPTVKYDGAACRIRDGYLWKRYDCKKGRIPPRYFDPAQEEDPVTGHWPGWVPIGSGPEDAHFREALTNSVCLGDGTYECVGPKVNRNPERERFHVLRPHGFTVLELEGRSFDAIKHFLEINYIEGIVFHHVDGRRAKIRRKDFGLEWGLV